MISSQINWKSYVIGYVIVACAFSLCALAFVLPAGTAELPGDPKQVALEVIERNADQIATVGDVLYYFAEPGMQEYESAKFVKDTCHRRIKSALV